MSLNWLPDPTHLLKHIVASAPSLKRKELYDVWHEVVEGDIYNTKGFIQEEDRWLDVGCHLGMFTIAAMLSGASGEGVIIDEDREMLRHAKFNVEINEALILAAIDPDMPIVCPDLQVWCQLIESASQLTDWGKEANAVKLDIQGAEREVFAGSGSQSLSNHFERMVFEWHYPLDDLELPGWDVIDTKAHRDVLLNTDTHIVWAVAE